MTINLNEIQNSLEEAINSIVKDLDQSEIPYIKESKDGSEFHFSVGMSIRNSWKLWDKESILHKHFNEVYGLGHADDMSGLILEGVVKCVKGIWFDSHDKADYYKKYWIKQGIDPLTQENIKI